MTQREALDGQELRTMNKNIKIFVIFTHKLNCHN